MDDVSVSEWMSAQTWPDVKPEVLDSAADAFRHPYGFVVVRLSIQTFDGWGIRVHLWPVGQRTHALSGSQYIHRHGWSLRTATLIGTVRHDSYVVKQGAQTSATWCAYTALSDRGIGESVLYRESCGFQATLADSKVSGVSSGLTLIEGDEFHTTTSDREDDWCVTLAATADRGTQGSTVLLPHGCPPVVTNSRERYETVSDLVPHLDALYRVESGIADRWVSSVFILHDGRALMVRTHRFPQYWQPIGGQSTSLDPDPVGTAIREVREESGLIVDRDRLLSLGSTERDRGDGLIHGYQLVVDSDWMPMIDHSEIAEHRWMTPAEIKEAATFGATHLLASRLLEG